MKKSAIFLLALASLGFTACDDTSDLGIEQKNPQEAIMETAGLSTQYGKALVGDRLDLSEYVSVSVLNPDINHEWKDEPVDLYNVVEAKDLPEDATVYFRMEMDKNEDFSAPQEISLTPEGTALGSELDLAYQQIWGRTPEANAVWVRFAAYVLEGTQISRIGGTDTWYGKKQITIAPVDLLLPIENSYVVKTFVDGTALEPIAMDHSSKHPYDDPEFSASIIVTPDQAKEGFSWEIESKSGKIYYGGSNGNLTVTGEPIYLEAGNYRLTVNMLDLTYSISLAYDRITTPGATNGWDAAAQEWQLTTTDYNNYYGFVWVAGEFKFATGSWDVNWGMGEKAGTLALGGANIDLGGTGLYYITLSLGNQTYTATKIEAVGMVGGFNGWNEKESLKLDVTDDGKTIKVAEAVFPKEGTNGELNWKFCFNNGWDINLGGSMEDLVPGGGDLTAPGIGKYEVTLNIATLPYSCTMTKK